MADTWQSVLAIWGAALSTALACLKFIEFRYSQVSLLDIAERYNPSSELIVVEITNVGKRPVVVRGVALAYGDADTQRDLAVKDQRIVLAEGQSFQVDFSKRELMDAASNSRLRATYSSAIIVRVLLLRRRSVERTAELDPSGAPSLSMEARERLANTLLGIQPPFPARVSGHMRVK